MCVIVALLFHGASLLFLHSSGLCVEALALCCKKTTFTHLCADTLVLSEGMGFETLLVSLSF